jgi:ABC-type Na+ efflux pump permease subunit
MNYRAMRAIIRKDLKVVLQSKAVLIPLIVVPFIILVLMPGIGGVVLANTNPDAASVVDFHREAELFFDNLPDALNDRVEAYDDDVQQMTFVIFNLFFPAMYVLLPTMVANVIAADSFAGEKERKTLEALIYVPMTDRELYLAKLIGPWIAGVAVGLLGYVVFACVVTLTTYSFMNEVFIVDGTWLLFIFWVTPAASGLGLGAMVLVSSRVSTFQEAYQLGGMVVIPLLLLLFGQLGGVVYFSALTVVAVGLALWLITLIMIWYGARTFERGQLIARL